MPSVPHEILLHVAHYIPARDLFNLMSVNSTFFELAMTYRYRQMSFAYLDNRMIRSLVRLRDPAVAKRVRILHVYPGFIQEALDREKHCPEPALRRSLRDKLADLGSFLLEQKRLVKHPRIRLVQTLKRAEDVVQVMLEVLSGLPNVTDYYVTWCGPPSVSATAAPFLSTVFQANLQKLSLELTLENVKNLLTPAFQVQNLKELHLLIHSESIASPHECGDIMRMHLAPAISRLRSTLEALTIQSWAPADFSPMFRAITTLSRLDQLVVAIPVEPTHFGHPAGFADFLTAHRRTLRVLRLRASQFGGQGLTPNLASLDCWIRQAICGVSLPNLQILDTSSNLFPVETSLRCLNQFCSTVTSLSLTGSYRTYDDVEAIVNLITSSSRKKPLNTLRIGLDSLSPQILQLISSRLPQLDRLDLVVKYLLPHPYDSPKLRKPRGDLQRTAQIVDFLTQMEECTFTNWQLRHLSVLAEFLPNRSRYEALLQRVLWSSVPSLLTYT